MHVQVDTVRTWRGRFAVGGLPALADRKRSGRPASFTVLQVAEVKALACQLPAETGTSSPRWSCPELAREVVAENITVISGSPANLLDIDSRRGPSEEDLAWARQLNEDACAARRNSAPALIGPRGRPPLGRATWRPRPRSAM
jgi:hypothetical protein